MSTLILGHTHEYPKESIHCSPIDVNKWYNTPFHCVDFWCNKDSCDFVYDIYRSVDKKSYWKWTFAEDNSYDTIIDCTGSIHWKQPFTKTRRYSHHDDLLTTITRVLKDNGKFFSYVGIYTKRDGVL